jgi:hypothetical protein
VADRHHPRRRAALDPETPAGTGARTAARVRAELPRLAVADADRLVGDPAARGRAALRDHPLDTVVYANNSRHPVEAWARSALTWQAVTTANTAACRTALDDLGVSYVEVRDGEECGWRDHQDPDRANRTLRTVQDALAHPTSHAHCIREFLPRLDLVGRTDIFSGAPL